MATREEEEISSLKEEKKILTKKDITVTYGEKIERFLSGSKRMKKSQREEIMTVLPSKQDEISK